MTDRQKRYSTYDRELLAIYQSIKHFKHLIEGRSCTVLTDHKPITFAFLQNPEKASPRQLNHLDFIGQYTTDIRYISGKDNVVADLLSRIESISINDQVDFELLAESQRSDDELNALLKSNSTALQLKLVDMPNTAKAIFCHLSTQRVRPFITKEFRQQIFNSVHNLAHPSKRSSIKQISERFVWPNMKQDIAKMARACIPCQKCKTTNTIEQPLEVFRCRINVSHGFI